jgi:hypothetical protein
MKPMFRNISGIVFVVCLVPLLLTATIASCMAQGNHVGQTAGVDDTKMGAYRALAQLAHQDFQKGNLALAAEHARILERSWDQAEGGGGDKSLAKSNNNLFVEIDRAMDVFIKPIMNYANKSPEAASVEAAYRDLMERLNQADHGTKPPPPSPQAIHLSPEVLKTFTGRYQPILPPDDPPGTKRSPVEITATQEGLWIDLGQNDDKKHQLLPLSAGEFFSVEKNEIHLTFTNDESGQVAGFTVTGYPTLQKATKLP